MEYRGNAWAFRGIYQFIWKYPDFCAIWIFYIRCQQDERLLMTLFYSLGLSLGVEVFQLLTRVGSFDVDDLLLNTIGGILGYVLFLICNGIRRKYDGRRK